MQGEVSFGKIEEESIFFFKLLALEGEAHLPTSSQVLKSTRDH